MKQKRDFFENCEGKKYKEMERGEGGVKFAAIQKLFLHQVLLLSHFQRPQRTIESRQP